MKERIKWIDTAKGIAMLLVIAGHSVEMGTRVENVVWGVIYSFHMPLFFVLGMYTYRLANNKTEFKENIKKSVYHIWIPMTLVFLCRNISDVLTHKSRNMWDVWNILLSYMYSSGVDLQVFGHGIKSIGYVWFLVVIFWGRLLLDCLNLYLNEKTVVAVSAICTLLGIVIGHYYYLPFSLDIVLAIMIFLELGCWAKKRKIKPQKKWIIICASVWTMFMGMIYLNDMHSMSLAGRVYTLFPICYIIAISGVYVFICICFKAAEIRTLRVINVLGANSLLLLCIHYLDKFFKFMWRITDYNILNAVIRILIDSIICILIVKVIEVLKCNKGANKA